MNQAQSLAFLCGFQYVFQTLECSSDFLKYLSKIFLITIFVYTMFNFSNYFI